MGLKSEIKKIVTKSIRNKIPLAKIINNTANTAIIKAGRTSGLKTAEEYIEKIKDNDCLIIKSRSCTLGNVVSKNETNDLKEQHYIFDTCGNVKYKTAIGCGTVFADSLALCTADGNQIGCVKGRLLSVGAPLEFKVKKCTVEFMGERICEIKKSVFMGDIEFEASGSGVKISNNEKKKFGISYKRKSISKLYSIPMIFQENYADKYVLEIKNPENEAVGVLLAIAIDFVLQS